MFKGCCFGGGVRGGGLKDSPDLSDNRRLRAVEPSGSKDTANGTASGVAVEESFVPKDEVVDSQTVGTLRRTTAADVPSVVSVDGGVNASNPLPKDKEDSNGISIYSLIMSYKAFWPEFNKQICKFAADWNMRGRNCGGGGGGADVGYQNICLEI